MPMRFGGRLLQVSRTNRGMRLLQGGRGLRTFFQRLAIPDPAFASIAGEFEILRKFERVDGTGVRAEAAKHAAAQGGGELSERPAAGLPAQSGSRYARRYPC